ncbi:hypothetical protein AB0K40_12060 [Nonomuraea bangladeshensis]|uniref:Uncharacterized protein n=1 Tax=Nonomuraea bangladeshensis TaxID=404385 RepID=A0ABV3H241_9ACTN
MPDDGREGELPLDLVLAPRELRTASVPERDLPHLDADSVVPDDPKEADTFVLRKDVYAETLLLTGRTEAFREGAKAIFAVTKDGPPAAATGFAPTGWMQLSRVSSHLRLGHHSIARGILPAVGKMTKAGNPLRCSIRTRPGSRRRW